MSNGKLEYLTDVERTLLIERDKFVIEENASGIIYYLRPCKVRVLIVVDGLDFSLADFGLRTFVETLLTARSYVKFEITLGHILGASGAAMMDPDARIAGRIPQFKFDNNAHFTPDKYDVVFLFGIATSFNRGAGYPNDSLSNAELQALAQFQNGGGGLFATGDHGALGKALCHKVARARSMRLWDSTNGNINSDEVSMSGPRRNDTNRIGPSAGSQFGDQSDDVPQPISPKIYSVFNGIWQYRFPHPVLCGPRGPIRVMPDHPHEGECITPLNPNLNLSFTAALGPEYPAAVGPGPRPLPEIISTSTVLSGTVSGFKMPTIAQSFGGICAYDGHRAGVGRVVTDATWHHFVNVNLIGDLSEPPGDPKRLGFLASAVGQVHLNDIKAYYRNLAVWLARPGNIRCMNARLLWWTVFSDRVLEAVLTTRTVKLAQVSTHTLWLIGRHARDVLGRFASQCQTRRLAIDIFPVALAERLPGLDPWFDPPDDDDRKPDVDAPWIDMSAALDVGLGAALVALNEDFDNPTAKSVEKVKDEAIVESAQRGAEAGLKAAFASFRKASEAGLKTLR